MRTCPNCNNEVSENAIFCDRCGTKLPVEEPAVEKVVSEEPVGGVPEGVIICSACGAENVPGEIFCDICGEPLEAPVPVEEVVVEEGIEEPVEEAIAEKVVEEWDEGAVAEEAVVEEAIIEEVVEEERYCPICGSIVYTGDTFCGSCGAVLDETAVEAEVPVEPEVAAGEEEGIAEEAIAAQPAEEAVMAMVEEELVEEEGVEEEQIVEEPAVVEVVAEELHCPACGATVLPDQVFCASCGAALQPVDKVVEEIEAEVVSTGPYLEIVDSGAHIPLVVQDELLIGRMDEVSGVEPDVDMTPHKGMEGGVSRRHAKLLHEEGQWFVVDLDSTNGTYLNGTELQPQVRHELNDGDGIGLGEVEAVFHAG
jgi:rRNA maturation endonuclease Nob1